MLLCSPLVGGWTAPPHPFLARARERKLELPCGVLPSGEPRRAAAAAPARRVGLSPSGG